MAFTIPTLTATSRWLRGVVASAVEGARADLWPNNTVVFVKALAMAAGQGNLRAQWIFKQIFVSTADADMLDLHGYEIGLGRKPAAAATGLMIFAATDGATLPAGAVIDAGGLSFTVRAAAVAAGNSITVPVDALETGPLGNLPPGAEVRLREPWPGVDQAGETGPLGLSGGVAKELDEPYRRRLIFRKRNKPRGGAKSDYEGWVGEVAGFTVTGTRAFAATPEPGTVRVYPLLEGTGAERIPGGADVARCADYLETKRPLTATVVVVQPVAKPIPVTLAQLANDSAETRAEIVAEMLDLFDERAFVARGGETFPLSWLSEAASRAVGESRHRLTVPPADVGLLPGEYPVFGGLTVVA
ncbi:MAG: baseplate J/gp47 family protein [Bosea sp.]|uniref:baseplate J/gp47 family protein n=1 Tax=Bosea sp. (in: a-proteobacteria) TaxID=1871050 RepID=UPI0023953C8C|nr:baseplate J/gp47 family protein [Bosea sp. (in: a-proteobacteria)]MCP4738444.1 baseplate J/gp47 family protein [Bosea sp. (in: a-proteobacteria)]